MNTGALLVADKIQEVSQGLYLLTHEVNFEYLSLFVRKQILYQSQWIRKDREFGGSMRAIFSH